MSKKFALFILTHKRPDKQITLASLEKAGYTGKTYLLCDDEDPTLPEYRKRYGSMVQTFSKKKWAGKFDLMHNEPLFNLVVYARNAVYSVARKLGLDYICVMDDDYSAFHWSVDRTFFYNKTKITQMDRLIKAHLRFLRDAKLATLAFAQAGDFPAGWNGGTVRSNFRPFRKAMNVFFFDVRRPVTFRGAINEDSTMGVDEAAKGNVVLTNLLVQITQTATQQAKGGLTEIYRDVGTYQKSFYTVMASPSSTIVAWQRAVGRVHHLIRGDNAYPKIISEDWKK